MGKLAAEDHTDQRLENNPTLVDNSIDGLAKGLASGTISRGTALRMMGGALLGGMLASVPGAAWAAKPKPGKRCKTDAQCPTGRVCVNRACQCPPGTTLCGGNCVDLQSDSQNCLTCGNACPGGSSCVNGSCVCAPEQINCGGVCTDYLTDEANCGLCGNACSAGETCQRGQCVAICPAASCCCVCQYQNPETGAFVWVCNTTNTAITLEQCYQSCQAATPPPGTVIFENHGYACESGDSGFQRVCRPTNGDNVTGTMCDRVQCLPPPT
jgi:hypothetical protein